MDEIKLPDEKRRVRKYSDYWIGPEGIYSELSNKFLKPSINRNGFYRLCFTEEGSVLERPCIHNLFSDTFRSADEAITNEWLTRMKLKLKLQKQK